MTFVKLTFALLLLVPVIILMGYLVNKLISEFTEAVKESREQEREREKALKEEERKRAAAHGRYGRRGPYPGYSREAHHDIHEEYSQEPHDDSGGQYAGNKTQNEAHGVKYMLKKRKRRKERRKKKVQEQER